MTFTNMDSNGTVVAYPLTECEFACMGVIFDAFENCVFYLNE